MPSRRLQRVNEQLRRELSSMVTTDLRDPRVAGVTVTSVEASRDLTFARVFVEIRGHDPDETEMALEGLEAAVPYLRRRLADALTFRHTPALRFVEDRSRAQASRIEDVLAELEIPPDPGEGDPAGG